MGSRPQTPGSSHSNARSPIQSKLAGEGSSSRSWPTPLMGSRPQTPGSSHSNSHLRGLSSSVTSLSGPSQAALLLQLGLSSSLTSLPAPSQAVLPPPSPQRVSRSSSTIPPLSPCDFQESSSSSPKYRHAGKS